MICKRFYYLFNHLFHETKSVHIQKKSSMRSLEDQQYIHKNQCVYCCKNQDNFKLCLSCNTAVCDHHMALHTEDTSYQHTTYCSDGTVYDYKNTVVEDSPEKDLAQRLKAAEDGIISLNLQSLGMNGANINCPHRFEEELIENKVEEFRCKDCELDKNLWLCLTCGNLGCGRGLAGVAEGNRHAAAHYEATGHPIAVKILCLDADSNAYDAEVYCYKCDDMIVYPEIFERLKKFGIDPLKLKATEKTNQQLMNDMMASAHDIKARNALSYDENLAGIINTGNTCYISSVMQSLYGCELIRNEFLGKDIDNHDPYKNLDFQIQRIFKGLEDGDDNIDVSLIQNLVAPEIFSSIGQIGCQQDAEEWFVALCRACDKIGKHFKFEQKSIKTCLSCGNTDGERSQSSYIWSLVQSDEDTDLFSLLEGYAGDFLESPCSNCSEGPIMYSTFCEHTADLVCFKTSRIGWDNNLQTVVKNTNKIKLNESLVPDNNFRDSPKLSFASTVVHSGSTYSSGHYIAFRKVNDKIYRFSDRVVSDEDDDEMCQNYLSFYVKQ